MKFRSKFAAATIMLVLVISLSLNIVSAINQTAIPGSDQDPLVSKSYVDAAFEQLSSRIQTLLTKNDELTNKIAEQEKQIKALQAELNALKSGTAADPAPSGGSNGGKTGEQQQPAAQLKGVVNVAALNLREKPNTSSRKLGTLYKNETITILSDEGNGWYKVKTSKGTTGYVFATYVTVKK
ncbi:MAG TPA: SH3 domain-containing protein [Clostridiales bacterium]|nr:SH3 domain-containing protein [Clostridiales bacterium]